MTFGETGGKENADTNNPVSGLNLDSLKLNYV